MNENFDFAFSWLMQDEGGVLVYTNKPTDRGGPTKGGISQKLYDEWTGHVSTVDDIRNLTPEVIKQIYFEKFWKPLLCPQYDRLGVAVSLFDAAVLFGLGTIAAAAQKSANNCGASLVVDRIIGDKSVAMINAITDDEFIKEFRNAILFRIDEICAADPKEEVNRLGWTNRANRLLTLINIKTVIMKIT